MPDIKKLTTDDLEIDPSFRAVDIVSGVIHASDVISINSGEYSITSDTIPARKIKPKKSNKGGAMDKCQSPPEVILPLLDFIPKTAFIWESAAGEGNIVRAFNERGYNVVHGDIESGQDFYKVVPHKWDIQVTNPPYGDKPKWTQRSYELGKSFALLMPVEFMGTARLHKLWKMYGTMQFILFTNPARINFKMPNKGWDGQAQFPTMWFTYGMSLPVDVMVWDYTERTWFI